MNGKRLVVQKYGGSSLSTPDLIQGVARRIADRARDNTRLVVAVSAMGRSTDELLGLAYQIAPEPQQRELDMLLTVGERISMALLSMALNAAGCPAISFTGSQSGIVTNVSHNRALIEEIRAERIKAELARGKVVIVAGFQGVSREKEVTTLGRGGSDTTAVAIAATLGAQQCEIYSDYPGVFTADPRWVRSARPIPHLTYDAMLELAVLGARVLHYRAADIARRYQVPLRLLSSFEDLPGTMVQENTPIEHANATSVTSNTNVSLVRFNAAEPNTLVDLMERIGQSDLQIISYHRESAGGRETLALVVDRDDLASLEEISGSMKSGPTMDVRHDLATVSVIGTGIACDAGTILRIERLLREAKISVLFAKTSSLSMTCLVPKTACKDAVDVLHTSFIAGDST